ncbi:hypothetical protein MmTuc01_3168 [Methanosarcina mazei Tuc01]|uniref:Uncharacterized protein n=1 Tax=Methanosarcina mazei Tuc01 TaxID=1236903 RepID=M1Q7Y1_METMZ|nr:hypothetical protein MmTuc01_3168 [Methanosarcina mazei Tuc01]
MIIHSKLLMYFIVYEDKQRAERQHYLKWETYKAAKTD